MLETKSSFNLDKDSLEISDLKFLIGLYSDRKKKVQDNPYLTNKEKSYLIIEYNKRIRELRRELKKKKTRRDSGVSEVSGVGDLEMLTHDMLDRLGYTKNNIYKEEAANLAHRFYLSYEWKVRHGRYSNNLLSACIVSEVLNHYLADYDLLDFLDVEQIELEDFKSLYSVVNEWSNYYYWK